MPVYCICDKDNFFVGFIMAKTNKQCEYKIHKLGLPYKIYKHNVSFEPTWKGPQRRLKFVREENGR